MKRIVLFLLLIFPAFCIDVVYVCNNDYVYVLSASLESLLSNKAKDDKITVHIMNPDFSDETKNKLILMTKDRAKLNFIKFNISLLDKAPKNFHIMTFAKFLIPNIFSSLDKIIYIDVDTIIMGSLKELYNTDLGDKYAGMIEDLRYLKRLDLDLNKRLYNNKYQDVKRWLNAGVIFFNLKKCRKDKIQERLLYEMVNVKHFFGDEPIFNYLFYGKILRLHPKWNATPLLFIPPYNLNKYTSYTKEQIEEASSYPIIIHFQAATFKSAHHELRSLFSFYLRRTPWRSKSANNLQESIVKIVEENIPKVSLFKIIVIKFMHLFTNSRDKDNPYWEYQGFS